MSNHSWQCQQQQIFCCARWFEDEQQIQRQLVRQLLAIGAQIDGQQTGADRLQIRFRWRDEDYICYCEWLVEQIWIERFTPSVHSLQALAMALCNAESTQTT